MLQSEIDEESEKESMNFDSCVARTISYSGGRNAFSDFMLVAQHELASFGVRWSSASLLLVMSIASL